jgi:hypothetical protein
MQLMTDHKNISELLYSVPFSTQMDCNIGNLPHLSGECAFQFVSPIAAGNWRRTSGMKKPSRETTARSDDTRAAEAAKIARLRGLRLAKEAADCAAVAATAPVIRRARAPAKSPRVRRP